MSRTTAGLAVLVLALLIAVGGAHAADPPWTASALCGGMSVGHAINASGDVAGAAGSFPSEHAVVCDSSGNLTVLPMPEGATSSRAVAINDLGQVAGLIEVGGFQEAAVWDADGSITRLGFLPDGGPFSSAQDINNEGEVVGLANLGSEYRAFHWDRAGAIEPLALPSGATGSMAMAINDSGLIVGNAHAPAQPTLAVLWEEGVPIALTPLAPGAATSAGDINELGQIAGSSATTEPPFTARHPVLWTNGVPADLGSLGGSFGDATGINDEGAVVGLMLDASGSVHGFSWNGGPAEPLEPLSGHIGSVAQSINDAGLVVGASFTDTVSVGTLWSQQADTTPPELTVSVSPSLLWPPNHRYVTVSASATAVDDTDPNPTVTLVSVTSNEPDDGPADGNTTNDIVIDGPFGFRLRAERNENGAGRTYSVTYRATDVVGNSAIASATVFVPITQ